MNSQLALLAVVLLASTTVGGANPKTDKQQCQEVKAKIRQIEAKMRNGYTASQGIRLDAQLRKLKDKRYLICR